MVRMHDLVQSFLVSHTTRERFDRCSRTSETRPAVGPALLEKVFETASLGSCVEKLSSIGIVEVDFTCCRLGFSNKGRLFKISSGLGIMSIEIADAIGRATATFPAKILLNWNLIVVVIVVVDDGRETKECVRRVISNVVPLNNKHTASMTSVNTPRMCRELSST
jgi:hypothetical protein